MKKSGQADAIAAVVTLIGLIVSFFLFGLVPALWILGAFLIFLIVNKLGVRITPVSQLVSLVLVPIGLVILFLRFGWAVALAFLIVFLLWTVVRTVAYNP